MNWVEDIRYALRALASRPLYAVASIAVLAIAIGANTTVFSVFNGLFLRPLPYPDGDRLVMVYDSYPKQNLQNAGTAIPDYIERREAASLENLAIVSQFPRTLVSDGPPQRLQVARASPSLARSPSMPMSATARARPAPPRRRNATARRAHRRRMPAKPLPSMTARRSF